MQFGVNASYDDIIAFHGHSCPGLALGYRMVNAALRMLSAERAIDEELVAITENDACGVDALQVLTGCTFGKGNLIFKDYGKMAFTFILRHSGKAVRVIPSVEQNHRRPVDRSDPVAREQFLNWVLTAPEEEVIQVTPVETALPPYAGMHASIDCALCGEHTMETRIHFRDGKPFCIPCFERESL